jgi:o-succinylbenzoate---CoA ligase
MLNFLEARHLSSPQSTAFISGDTTLNYAELHRLSLRFARRLITLGVMRGVKVGVLMPNNTEYVLLVHACLSLGAILVPLNTRLTANEIDYQMRATDCQLVFCSQETESIAGQLLAPMRRILNIHLPKDPIVEFIGNIEPSEFGTFNIALELDTPFVVIFTSGTSGQPKGALLTIGNFFYNALGSAYHIGTMPNDRWLCVLPFYHVGGLSIILRCCLYGTCIEILSKFDAEILNQHLAQYPITLVSLVPTMLYRMLEIRTAQQIPQALRLVLLGGASASPELLAKAKFHNVPIATTYGLSEATSQVATALPQTVLNKGGTVGKPLMFTKVMIVDELGNPLSTKQYGEICVAGETIMQKYINNADATQNVLRDGWLRTGDIGYIDDEGDLWVLQRRTDLIVSGGENVYPTEVEAVLRSHPDIEEAVVLGIPDAEWGQKVVSAIVLLPNRKLTIEDIKLFCNDKLARYKQPRQIMIVDELPLTASGKVQRSKVREWF